MKLIPKLLTRFLTSLSLLMSVSAPVLAQGPAPSGALPVYDSQTSNNVGNLVGGYGVNQLQNTPMALFSPSPDALNNTSLGPILDALVNMLIAAPIVQTFNIQTNIGSSTFKFQALDDFMSSDLTRMLTDTSPALNTAAMTQIPAPMPISSTALMMSKLPTQSSSLPYSSSPANFDMNSLLLPLQYNTSQENTAWYFIQYSSGMAQHLGSLDLSRLSTTELKSALQSNGDFQSYLVGLRSLSSAQSVGLSNLYFLYGERIPQNTTSLANVNPGFQQTPLYPQASSLQFENYIATRRLSDPSWTKTIQTVATPAELQRQTIYLLRDMLYMQYQRQLVDERILATLSVMQLNGLSSQQQNVQLLMNKVAQEKPFNPNPPSNIAPQTNTTLLNP